MPAAPVHKEDHGLLLMSPNAESVSIFSYEILQLITTLSRS